LSFVMGAAKTGPILFAYDGSEPAKAAIREAATQLRNGRRAIVLTVWQPAAAPPFAGALGVPPVGLQESLEQKARNVAGKGAQLARSLGFDAEPLAERADPLWRGIVESADKHDAGIVVLGSHGRTGVAELLLGSVAAATARHSERPVMIAKVSSHHESEASG
jgi:nucleotide-binding universal stress UspA family protein